MRRGAPPKPQKEKMKISNSTAKQVEEEDMKRATHQAPITRLIPGSDDFVTILDIPGKGELIELKVRKNLATPTTQLRMTIDEVVYTFPLPEAGPETELFFLSFLGSAASNFGQNNFATHKISFSPIQNINFATNLKIELQVATGEEATIDIVYGLEE
jgi:hypothetical protein